MDVTITSVAGKGLMLLLCIKCFFYINEEDFFSNTYLHKDMKTSKLVRSDAEPGDATDERTLAGRDARAPAPRPAPESAKEADEQVRPVPQRIVPKVRCQGGSQMADGWVKLVPRRMVPSVESSAKVANGQVKPEPQRTVPRVESRAREADGQLTVW
ncbi:hypothetical protein NDU88_004844 [Pleurodeles waltl]|uniref:Uncharacterized protein n=1 Tax=Pleurodeles waltl TaxID=8319 RepID=A0AAV7V2B5_PLEWA|nr:hypothetical protein NDU88_004844 [Pleurodeles waltl]